MKEYLTSNECVRRLLDDTNANWSRAGATALVQHLEEMEIETDDEQEFCVVDIRCIYSEYESAVDAATEYGWEPKDAAGEDYDIDPDSALSDQREHDATLWLMDRTTVIVPDVERIDLRRGAVSCDTIVIQNF
jgi:hypothetical protein